MPQTQTLPPPTPLASSLPAPTPLGASGDSLPPPTPLTSAPKVSPTQPAPKPAQSPSLWSRAKDEFNYLAGTPLPEVIGHAIGPRAEAIARLGDLAANPASSSELTGEKFAQSKNALIASMGCGISDLAGLESGAIRSAQSPIGLATGVAGPAEGATKEALPLASRAIRYGSRALDAAFAAQGAGSLATGKQPGESTLDYLARVGGGAFQVLAPVAHLASAGTRTGTPAESAPTEAISSSQKSGSSQTPAETMRSTIPMPEEHLPAPEPIAAAREIAATPSVATPIAEELPRNLVGSKPRYGYRNSNFQLQFESPADKALYTVAQSTKNAAHDQFMGWLQQRFPGKSPEQLVAMGQQVRDSIKNIARNAGTDTDTLTVPRHEWNETPAQTVLSKIPTPEPSLPAPQPLRVYHGTSADVTDIASLDAATHGKPGVAGIGDYLTTRAEDAGEYAGPHTEATGGRVISGELSPNANLLDAHMPLPSSIREQFQLPEATTYMDALEAIRDNATPEEVRTTIGNFQQAVANAGFHGVRYNNGIRDAVMLFPGQASKLLTPAVPSRLGVQPTPPNLAEQAGLLHKGEVVPGTGVHQFEHPDYPGITMGTLESDLSTPQALKQRMNAKIDEMRANPSTLVKAILARGDAAQASAPGAAPLPPDVQARIDKNVATLRSLADPTKINSPGDVSSVLSEASEKLARNTDPRISEKLSAPLRRALANELGLSENELLSTPIGQAHNAETVEAARQLLANSRENVLADAKAVREDPSRLDDFITSLARHNEISGTVRGQVAREAGRALQAFNDSEGQGSSARARTIDEAVRDLSAMPEDAKREAARRFALLDPSEPGAIERFAREVKPATTADKLYEGWMNAILTSGAVPAKIVGDLSMQLLGIAAKPIAGAFDMLRSAARGTPRERYGSEVAPFLYGQLAGTPDAIDRFARTFKNEVGSQDNEFEPPRIAIKGKTGRIVRIPSRVLAAVTDYYNSINYAGELHASAYRTATQEGLHGQERIARIRELVAHPTDDMKEGAANFARTQTFQDNFRGEGWYNAGMREALKLKTNKLARWLFPFLRTPANIVRENARFSPAGIVGTAKGAIAGDLRGGNLSDAAAKNVIGSAVFLWALHKALGGHITGAGPSDPRKREALQATGWQPYSVLKDGEYSSFRRLVPVNYALGAAADIAEQLRTKPDDPALAGRIYSAITRTSKQVLDNPFLPTITNIANAMQSTKKAASFASYETIPGFVRDIAHATDRTVRVPRTPAQEFENNLPGLTGRVPARIDVTGQPIKRPVNQLGGFNPFPDSPVRNNPVVSEAARLGIGPMNAPSKVSAPRTGLPKGAKAPSLALSDPERAAVQRQDAAQFSRELSGLMANPRWAHLTDTQRTAILREVRAKISATRFARVRQLRSQQPQ